MAEQMQVEDDDDAELLGALLQEGVVGPQTREAAREANKVYELVLMTGVSRGDAVAKVSELFSPPRVTAELGRLPVMSLVGGSCFDLRGDANGVARRERRGLGLHEGCGPRAGQGAGPPREAVPGDREPAMHRV